MEEKRPLFRILLLKISQNAFCIKVYHYLRKLIIPGFQGVPFLDVMKFFLESLVKGILFQRAAAMTYQVFVAVIPMLLALFAAISFLGEPIQMSILSFIQSVVPDYTWPAISKVITEVVTTKNGVLFYTSMIMGLYLTFLGINAIINTLNITYFNIETRKFFSQLLVSVIIVLVFFAVVVFSGGIFIATRYIIHYFNAHFFDSALFYTYAIAIARWLLIFIVVYCGISALFYFAPLEKKNFKFFSAGSTFATLMLIILLYALNFYFAHFSNYNVVYGSIGALLAILLWLNWSCIIVLIGFDLNVSISVALQKKKSKDDILIIESGVK
ncbi:MAG: YihY/virulence factor BrkB family protein [Bacteroidales bacterium]|jgi:membrane protein|nr:YihY/virulence factor BrkB family protein [Bacteroidales bacterium]